MEEEERGGWDMEEEERGWIRVTPSSQSEASVEDATDVCLFGNIVSHWMCM
jgi:hypothetical protein